MAKFRKTVEIFAKFCKNKMKSTKLSEWQPCIKTINYIE